MSLLSLSLFGFERNANTTTKIINNKQTPPTAIKIIAMRDNCCDDDDDACGDCDNDDEFVVEDNECDKAVEICFFFKESTTKPCIVKKYFDVFRRCD